MKLKIMEDWRDKLYTLADAFKTTLKKGAETS
jgi:hypothetical protein